MTDPSHTLNGLGSGQDQILTGRVADATGLSQVEPQEGLAPPGFDPSRIIPRLGKRQRAVLLSLSSEWGKAAFHETAKRLWWTGVGDKPWKVIEHKHQSNNCWRLSKSGAVLRNAIVMEARQGGDGEAGSVRSTTARAEGIVQPSSSLASGAPK